VKKLIAWLAICFLVLYVLPWAGTAAIRGLVSDSEMATRETIAQKLASRSWTEGPTYGKVVDGHLQESVIPPQSAKPNHLQLTKKYSDHFQTYTVFEFESKDFEWKYEIMVGRTYFRAWRGAK
jgi:hypothetical protein